MSFFTDCQPMKVDRPFEADFEVTSNESEGNELKGEELEGNSSIEDQGDDYIKL